MISIFQHGDDEGPGTIQEYLVRRQIPSTVFRLYAGDEIPRELPESLIILGGQMSVNDLRDHPYFAREKILIRDMVRAGRPVLGICLGAQMIASAFGEEVRKGPREIGWKKVQAKNPEWSRIFPGTFPVFHWHEETFNLPEGSTLLVQGETVTNQAFRLGSATGVQFHPEVTEDIVSAWAKDLPESEIIRLLDETRYHFEENRHRCHRLVDAFIRGWGI